MGAPQYEQAGADIGGTGTTNTIPRWTGPSTLGDSGLIDNGTAVYTTTRNFGIGTASPQARLHISGGTSGLRLSGDFSTTIVPIMEFQSIRLDANDRDYQLLGSGSNVDELAFQAYLADRTTRTSYGYSFLTTSSSTPTLRLTGAGNVGIGTASPTSFGAGYTGLSINGTTTGVFEVMQGGSGALRMFSDAGTVQVQGLGARAMICSTGGIARLRISSAGAEAASQVAIGTGSFTSGCSLTVAQSIDVSQSAQGLKLPATPGNADTQTLDAYKEGTFTATLKGGTSDPTTPVTVTGNYVLVGKTMTVTVYFANVTTTGAAGNVYITTDLAAALRPGTRGTAAVGLEVFTTGAGVGSFIDVRTDGTFYLLENFNNGGTAIGQHNAGTNRYLWFTATYIIA